MTIILFHGLGSSKKQLNYIGNYIKSDFVKQLEKIKLTNDNDIFTILKLALFDFADLKNYYKKEKIEEYKPIDIPKEDEEILKPFLDKLKLTKENHNFLLRILYKIIFYEKYEKKILGDKFIKAIPPKLYIPLDCILFIIKNIYEPEKIVKYLIKNK